MNTDYSTHLTRTACAIALALSLSTAHAKSFVTEATRVVDGVTEQSQQANGAIESFYQEFSGAATAMVDLEARVEQWRQQDYLCESYRGCPEKYDLIYAHYGQSMARIQKAFDTHRDEILSALSRFNQAVYNGKDQLSDLQSDDLSGFPVDLSRLSREQDGLRVRKAELEHECPKADSRSCARQLEIHVLDVGNLMNDRLDQIAGHDIDVGSRSDMIGSNARLLKGNDQLLRDLEKEIGTLQAELDKKQT